MDYEEKVMDDIDHAIEKGFEDMSPQELYNLCEELKDMISLYKEKIQVIENIITEISDFKNHIKALYDNYMAELGTD